MPAQYLYFFSKPRAPAFWQEHTISVEQTQLRYEPRDDRDFMPTDLTSQRKMRARLTRVMADSRSPLAKDALIIASGNVKTFNAAFPSLPKIDHPSLIVSTSGAVPLRQLAHEFSEVEKNSTPDSAAVRSLFAALAPMHPRQPSDLRDYYQKAVTQVEADNLRLTTKYDHIAHVTRAAYQHIQIAHSVVTVSGAQVISPPQREALVQLHRAVKASLRAAKDDLFVSESLFNRAASGLMQLAQASDEPYEAPKNGRETGTAQGLGGVGGQALEPKTEDDVWDYPIAPMRLPNLFGPGEMHIDTAYTRAYMDDLFSKLATTLSDLRTKQLRPRISELTVVDGEMTALSRRGVGASVASSGRLQLLKKGFEKPADNATIVPWVPVFLGPLGKGKLFNRSADALGE